MHFLFAWRYFKAKKSTNAINIIAWVSIIAIIIGTAALILVLSVFNGFEGLVKSLYSSFYTDLKISPVSGKTINLTAEQLQQLKVISGVKNFSLVIEEKALAKKVIKLVCSLECTSKKEPIIPTKAVYNINKGIINVVASTRVTTRNLKGLIAETSIASICSVTFIEPSSAPILEPTFPAQIRAVTKGAKALMIAIETNEGNQDAAPKSASDGRDCLVNTSPVINPVKVMRGKDLYPTSKHWRITSLSSKGGTKASLKKRMMNWFMR